jgi:hypothetical protein
MFAKIKRFETYSGLKNDLSYRKFFREKIKTLDKNIYCALLSVIYGIVNLITLVE